MKIIRIGAVENVSHKEDVDTVGHVAVTPRVSLAVPVLKIVWHIINKKRFSGLMGCPHKIKPQPAASTPPGGTTKFS